MMVESPTLVLVCKRPTLGFGKQRLSASLGVVDTHRIAQALLNCALEDVCGWNGPVVISPSTQQDFDWANTLLLQSQVKIRVQPQAPGNLGQRINALDQGLRDTGMERLVYIGSDAPGLVTADYVAARNALQQYDTVLIPATDGGVVLMASSFPWPRLAGLPWSSDQLCAALTDCCHVAGQSVVLLSEGFDVDELGDLGRLASVLADDQRPARRVLHTLACDIIHAMEASNA